MTTNPMDYRYLVQTETEARQTTVRELRGWSTKYPEMIDILFESSYYTGKSEEVESDQGMFFSIAHQHLLRLPYTVRAAAILLESAYYLETVLLLRNMYEVLVQLRYFHRHFDQLRAHSLRKRRITFRAMFEEVVPGFYENIYSRQLCEYVHGGAGSIIFRTTYQTSDQGTVIMGCQFSEALSTFSLNQMLVILSGWLSYIPIFFPAFPTLAPAELQTRTVSAIQWLNESADQHRRINPKAKKFYDLVAPFVSVLEQGYQPGN